MIQKSKGIISWLAARTGTSTPSLGHRELAILEILWQCGEQSAQQVLDHLQLEGIGLSTVQSTLERLHRKQLVIREKQSRAYIYSAQVSRHSIISSLLHDITAEIAGGDMAPMVSGFMEYLDIEAPAIKSALTAMLDQQDKNTPGEDE